MFDQGMVGPAAVGGLDDAALVDALVEWNRAVNAAEARRLAVVAEMGRRSQKYSHLRRCAVDDWDAVTAQISCALNMGHGRAETLLDTAVLLRDRYPQIAALFMAGRIGARTVALIEDRTRLVDAATAAQLDAVFAADAEDWEALSWYKLEQAIDTWIQRHDPAAVRRARRTLRSRYFTVGDPVNDEPGATHVRGRLDTVNAQLFDQRLTVMIAGVCPDDPRTLDQLRSDAIGALGAGVWHLACRCGNPDCPATAPDAAATSVVVHIVTDTGVLAEPVDPELDGPDPDADGNSDTDPGATDESTEDSEEPDEQPGEEPLAPAASARRSPGVIPGIRNGVVPAPLLAGLIAQGAHIRFVGMPDTTPEPRYRPSTALQRFVRARDLTCRWPGCDKPAEAADIDHTTPWPAGATHPSNTKCNCRRHHLIKTFVDGFTDQQSPDGTVVLTTPTGHRYTTTPFGAFLFPGLRVDTGPAPSGPPNPTHPGKLLMMPARKQTRAQTRQRQINAERRRNQTDLELEQPPPF
ncbi:HNH endonuclease signature motif containing protein [Mycobacterium sp. ACS4331]|uniref:HNH endonuclease signature motif containing protein n=1 Tax=Mycobacterium sp. ACS4331 TaxID=1834121 RepID=UPI0007FF809F|nr:HNH endonuclease signature motif containing protein [Mycobacterium sp. ACS4331]OBF09941.1 hypothetical protein A5727_21815 [Mycobacterium sp. ACS4331]